MSQETEVSNRSASPYRMVMLVISTFPDGTRLAGTGSLVGRNDILTATHVIYDPDAGGWATDIQLYPGVDFSTATGTFQSQPLLTLGPYQWTATAWPDQTFADASNSTMTSSESQYDLALVGISEPIGDTLGWFGLGYGYNQTGWAEELGYPVEGTGLMYGQVLASHSSGYSVYSASASDGSAIMGAGSSGGPLYLTGSSGQPILIGVKSSGTATLSQWADIDLLYEPLLQAIQQNDRLLGEPAVQEGTPGNDVLYATLAADRIDGLAGLDQVIYSQTHEAYQVSATASGFQVSRLQEASDTDQLQQIERLVFSDGRLALDVGAGETSGSLYRLYQAAFDRTPDTAGLDYWISQMDQGMALYPVAGLFMDSPEFIQRYGQNPDADSLVRACYANVLARSPDAGGYAYWTGQLEAGLDPASLLLDFSESQENQIRVAAQISDGLWLG